MEVEMIEVTKEELFKYLNQFIDEGKEVIQDVFTISEPPILNFYEVIPETKNSNEELSIIGKITQDDLDGFKYTYYILKHK